MYPSATLFKLFPYVVGALAAIGPTANLVITNKNISPDGFTRSYVAIHFCVVSVLLTG